jgi:hypothetical protein
MGLARGEAGLRCDGWRMKLLGVHWDGRRWRVILRIDRKSEHAGYFGLLWSTLICANYHIAYLGLSLASKAMHPVLIAEKPRKRKSVANEPMGGRL